MNTEESKGYATVVAVDEGDIKQSKKIVDWKNPPTLRTMKEDFQAAEDQTSKQVSEVGTWLDALNCQGEFKAPEIPGRSKVSVRMIRKQLEWRCPSLTEPFLSSPKLFQVNPRTYEDLAAAKQNELLLNYQFKNKINLVKFMDELVRTAASEGTAIVHTYWNYRTTKGTEVENEYDAVPVIDDELFKEEITQHAEMAQQDPEYLDTLEEPIQLSVQAYLETGGFLEYVLVKSEEIEVDKVVLNHPGVKVVPVEDVFVDPNCKGELSDAKFLVYRFRTCLGNLKQDGRYTNLEELENEIKTDQHSTTATTREAGDNGFQFKDVARKNIEAYEYWGYYDIYDDGNLHPIVATWVGRTLIRMELNPYPDNGIPFVFIPLIPISGSVYGQPDAELLKENQQIISATMRGAVDLFGKSANSQTGIAKGFLDGNNLARFNAGENYNFNPALDPTRAIHQHKFPEIPQSVFAMMSYLTNEADALSGVKSFSQGLTGDSLGKTARGARTALDASAKRDASILRRLAQGMVEIAYKFQTMNSTFLTENDVIRLTNNEFVPVDPDNLSGDFDLIIDISTAEADQQQIETLAMILQTGQQSLPFEFTKKILAKIANLARQPDLEQFLEEYEPEPDPFQQQLQQLEIQHKQAEIEEILARAEEMRTKSYVNMAEVRVRGERAENMAANTDEKAIRSYKDAAGITQEEKLQLEEAKQRAKAQDDLRKHDLTMQAKDKDHNLNLLNMGAQQELEAKSYAEEAKIPMNKVDPLK